MICCTLELWIVVIRIAYTYRECGLSDMSRVRSENSQLILLPILVIQWFLEYDFSAEFINREDRRCDVIGVIELRFVARCGHEAVGDGGICVNVIR